MAIQTQYPFVNEEGQEFENLIKTYSDEGKQILQNETGNIYDEAVDVYPCRYTYSEVEEPIESEETNEI